MIRGRFERDGRLDAAGAESDVTCLLDGTVTNLGELGSGSPERVVAKAWARFGDDLPARLEGQFAVVLWDRASRRGLLVRDRLGLRGLYTCEHDGALLFASELRDLARMLPRRPAPDALAVAHYVSNTGVPGRRTLYEGIERLAPGELVRVSPDGWERRRWWWPKPRPHTGDPATALREAMAAAVRRALIADRRPGVRLSGGFDSGAVAVLAARESTVPPVAYSCVFPEHGAVDESAAIAATRTAAGLPGHEQRYGGGRSALAAALEFLAEWELPPASPNGYLWRPLIRRAAADGVELLLDGEGGDEMVGCPRFLIADALRGGRLREARALARRLPGMGEAPSARTVRRALARYGVRGALPPRLHARLRRPAAARRMTSPLLRPELGALHRADRDEWAWKRLAGPRWRARHTYDVVFGSEALGAAEHFRREAAMCGVEFGQPFRDARLLEAVLGLPPEEAFDPRLDRALARRAMAGLLPDSVRLASGKARFNVLLEEALRGPDRAALGELLGRDARIREFLTLPPGYGELPVSAPPRAALELFRVAAAECWLRQGESDPLLERLRLTLAGRSADG